VKFDLHKRTEVTLDQLRAIAPILQPSLKQVTSILCTSRSFPIVPLAHACLRYRKAIFSLTHTIFVSECVPCVQLWRQELDSVLTAAYWKKHVLSTISQMRYNEI